MNSSPAMHLLWKDFCQVRPALLACLGMLAGIQLLYLIAQLLEKGTSLATFQYAYFIALVAPTLVAIACSGLMIGQERQTRTWNWSSSLPITWPAALASKFVVWFVASVVLTVLLLGVYGLLHSLALLWGRVPSADADWPAAEVRVMFTMLLLIPFEVFVVFSIAALLWNDTLLALVLAAIVLSLGHLWLIDVGTRVIHGIPRTAPTQPLDHLATVVGLLVTAIALAAVGLCYAFRWRWTSGQLSSVTLRDVVAGRLRPRDGGSSPARALGYKAAVARPKRTPSETAMMVMHAWRSERGNRAAVIAAALMSLYFAPPEWNIFAPVLVLASILLGVTVFGGQHPLGRYRFFADRGASWIRFLVTHLGVGLMWMLGLVVLTYWLASVQRINVPRPYSNTESASQIAVALCAFGLAVFSSLCITNSVIAATFAGLILIASAASYLIAESFFTAIIGHYGHVLVGVPLTVMIILAGLIYQTRQWFVWDRPRSLRVLITAWLAGLMLPIWLCLTFGYLAIPSTPWLGIPTDQLNMSSAALLPRLANQTDLTGTISLLGATPTPAAIQQQIAANYRGQLQIIEGRDGDLSAWLDDWQTRLDGLKADLSKPEEFVSASPVSFWEFSNLIEQSAFAGVAATQARDQGTALAAWEVNRDLLKLAEGNSDLAAHSLAARTVTWGLWNLLNDDDLAFLEDSADLSALLPARVSKEVWSQVVRRYWTIRKLALRSAALGDWQPYGPNYSTSGVRSALECYPPLRWAVERQMALQLKQDLDALGGVRTARTLEETWWIAAREPIVDQIQMLRQFEEQVTAKLLQTQ